MSHPRVAVAVQYLWSAVPAFFLALPLGLLVGGLWGHQGGDALLWEAGGLPLVETLRLLAPSLTALAWGLPWLLLLWSLGGVLPQALVLALLTPGDAPLRERAVSAFRALPTLVFVLGAALLVRVLVVALGWIFSKGLAPGLLNFSDPVRSLGPLPIVLLVLVLLSLVRVFHDLAAVAVLRQGETGSEALLLGLEVIHRRPFHALGAWSLRAVPGLLAVGVAVSVGSWWHSGAGLLVTLLMHQGCLLVLASLRVSWLQKAVSLIER